MWVRRWFKTDNMTFTVGSEYPAKKLAPRTYSSFSDATREVVWSRCNSTRIPSLGDKNCAQMPQE